MPGNLRHQKFKSLDEVFTNLAARDDHFAFPVELDGEIISGSLSFKVGKRTVFAFQCQIYLARRRALFCLGCVGVSMKVFTPIPMPKRMTPRIIPVMNGVSLVDAMATPRDRPARASAA